MTTAEIIAKFFALANPPPTLFRYRPPTKWTLDEISKQQIYAAKPDELNDPFEYSAPIRWDVDLLRRKFVEEFAPTRGLSPAEATKQFDEYLPYWTEKYPQETTEFLKEQAGTICLSAVPNSIRMWSYYTKSHEGICISYDTKVRPFRFAINVTYQNPSAPLEAIAALKRNAAEIAGHVSLRKAEEWEFEQEYRIPIAIGNNPRVIRFHPSAITEIRFGVRINANPEFKEKLLEAISQLPHRPKLIQMGCDYDKFVLTETVI
jgi:hypothetical protein